MRRALLLSCVLLLALGTRAYAQSTAFGKILYAPDKAWSWGLRQWPALSNLDKTEERSAGMTGVIVYGGGYALSKATPMSFRRAREVVAFMYYGRTAYGLLSGETTRYRAHAKHVAVATAVATLRLRWEWRF